MSKPGERSGLDHAGQTGSKQTLQGLRWKCGWQKGHAASHELILQKWNFLMIGDYNEKVLKEALWDLQYQQQRSDHGSSTGQSPLW